MTTNFVIGLAILVILVLVAATIALVSMMRGHKAPGRSAPPAAEAPHGDSAPPEPETPPPAPAVPDVVARADLAGAPDALTTLKGLGPKAAAQLNALGITRFAQLAALDDAGVAALDARMAAFKGRIVRDRWVEQAAYLAAGDTAAFEATFGKLGGRREGA